MSEQTQPPEGSHEAFSRKERIHEARLEGRAEYGTGYIARVYCPQARDGKEAVPRLTVDKGTQIPGLFRRIIGRIKDRLTGKSMFPVPVMHLKNDLPEDDRGFRPPIGLNILKAAYQNGWVIFAGKHMFPAKTMLFVRNTFARAVDAAAYLRGLGAPTIGKGYYKNQTIVFKDITSVNSDGHVIHAGCDGSGRIHPDHLIFQTLGYVCPIQIRIWNPKTSMFCKGILVPDNRCLDDDGRPIIWVDWLQIKGNEKDDAKSKCGLQTGAFGNDGVLVDESLLVEETVGEGYHIAILQVWNRAGRGIKWCFEILERVQDTKRTREIITILLREAIAKFVAKGGVRGIFKRLAEEDPKLQLVDKLCTVVSEATGRDMDPLRIPYVWNYVQDELQRTLYHFRQGAGQRSMRFVAVIDNAVPPGHVVMDRVWVGGKWRYNHEDEVAVTRFPMILPQALKVLKVINPRIANRPELDHLLIKSAKGQHAPQWVMYFNEHDLVRGLQGDDDGDYVLADWRPIVIELFRYRVSMIPGRVDATFLIEPGKAANNWKSKVPLLQEDGTMSEEALKIVGMDSQGPVGQLTYYCAMFLALNMRMHALACAVLVQEAIDQTKHVVNLSDPSLLIRIENWHEVSPDVFEPRDCLAEDKWYDETGCLNMELFGKWAKGETRGLTIKDVLTWRGNGKKRTREDDWDVKRPKRGENLVHWCNVSAFFQWNAAKDQIDKPNHNTVELLSILPAALGRPISIESDIHKYKDLKHRSGLVDFGKNCKKILQTGLEPEERSVQIDAEYQLLRNGLNTLSIDEVLTIWCTELHLSKPDDDGRLPKHWVNNLNRAFRSITFSDKVLRELGIELEDNTCQFLSGILEGNGTKISTLKKVFQVMEADVKEGRERSIYTAAANFSERFDEAHAYKTGNSAKGCRHCQRIIDSKVVNFIRSQREEQLDVDGARALKQLCGGVNKILREEAKTRD